LNFMLDTNACIALINGRPESVRRRFDRAISKNDEIATSSIVLFELWYGVAKSAHPKVNAERLATFIGGPIEIVDFTLEDAEHAGRIRAALEAAGRPIGAYDELIAGQAQRLGSTLVTANAAEFSRIKALRIQDWSVR
jgi:tRNA(fMet)-specific endonuclease VapC